MNSKIISSIVFAGLFCSACSTGLDFFKSSDTNSNTKVVEEKKTDDLPNDAKSCMDLALSYYEGENKDDQKARQLFEKACELENSDGCFRASEYYLKGIGVNQNHYRAKDLLEKSCALNNMFGCAVAGMMYA